VWQADVANESIERHYDGRRTPATLDYRPDRRQDRETLI
jgi:hypothetical protein